MAKKWKILAFGSLPGISEKPKMKLHTMGDSFFPSAAPVQVHDGADVAGDPVQHHISRHLVPGRRILHEAVIIDAVFEFLNDPTEQSHG